MSLAALTPPFAVEHLYDATRTGDLRVVHRERRRVLLRAPDGSMLWAYLRHGRTVVRTERVVGQAAVDLETELVAAKRTASQTSDARDEPRPRYGRFRGGEPLRLALGDGVAFTPWHPRVQLVAPQQAHVVAESAAHAAALHDAFVADGWCLAVSDDLAVERIWRALEHEGKGKLAELVAMPHSPIGRGRFDGDRMSIYLLAEERWLSKRGVLARREPTAKPLVIVEPGPPVPPLDEPTPLLNHRITMRLPRGAVVGQAQIRGADLWRLDHAEPDGAPQPKAHPAATPERQTVTLALRHGRGASSLVWEITDDGEPNHEGVSVTARREGEPLDWLEAYAAHVAGTLAPSFRQPPQGLFRFVVAPDRPAVITLDDAHTARVMIADDVSLLEISGLGGSHSRFKIHALSRRELQLPYVAPSESEVVADLTWRRDAQRGRIVRDAVIEQPGGRCLYLVSEAEDEASWQAHLSMFETFEMLDPAAATDTEARPDWDALYDVAEHLGRGGVADVHRVLHKGWAMELAVKRPRDQADDPQLAKSLTHEAEAWTRLAPHPNVVSCYQVRRHAGVPHIFVELVRGGSLAEWIEDGMLYRAAGDASQYSSGETHRQASAFARIIDIAIQVAHGLHHAHEHGLIHQDVKPANVMVTPEGVAKVTDFGLVNASGAIREVELERGTIASTCGGLTPAYCSPEQASAASGGGEKLTRRSDVWSWAVTLLEMLNGGVTWRSGALARRVLEEIVEHGASESVAPPMPRELADLLERCLRYDPAERPHDMLEIAIELGRIYHQTLGTRYPRHAPEPVNGRAAVLNNRGASLMDLGQADLAVAAWREATDLDPLHLEASYNLALYAHRHGGRDLEQRVSDLLRAHPSRPDAAAAAKRARGELGSFRALASLQLALAPRLIAARDGLVVLVCDVVLLWSPASGDLRSFDAEMQIDALHLEDSRLWLAGDVVRCFSLVDLTCLRTIDVAAVSIHAAADRVVLGDSEGRVHIFEDGERSAELQLHKGPVIAVHDEMNASADRVLVMRGLACVDVFEVAGARDVKFGEHFISVASAGRITRIDLHFRARQHVAGEGATLDHGGRLALEPTLRVWDLDAGRMTHAHAHGDSAVALAIDDDLIAAARADGVVNAWRRMPGERAPWLVVRPRSSEQLQSDEARFGEAIAEARASLDDGEQTHAAAALARAGAVVGYRRSRELFRLRRKLALGRGAAGDALLRAMLSTTPWARVAMSADATRALCLDASGLMSLWRIDDAQIDDSLHLFDAVADIALSADGTRALSLTANGRLLLWDIKADRHIDLGGCGRCAMSRDGASLLMVDEALWLIDVASESRRRQPLSIEGLSSLAIASDRAIAGYQSGEVVMWQPSTGAIVAREQAHASPVHDVAIAEGIALSAGANVTIWAGAPIATHISASRVGLTADGQLGLTIGKSAAVWDLRSRSVAHELDDARDIAISADALCAVTCSDSGLRVWELDWQRI